MSEEMTVLTDTPSQESVTPEPVVTPEAPPETPLAETTAEPPQEAPVRVVPEPDGYVLPEGIPPEIGQFAKTNDMTQTQLDATLQHFGTIVQNNRNAEAASIRQAGEAHIAKWGEQGDYNMSLARRALAQNDPDGTLKQALDSSGFGNHPAVLDFLFTLGSSMKEGGYLKSAINRPPGKKTAAQSMYGENHPSEE